MMRFLLTIGCSLLFPLSVWCQDATGAVTPSLIDSLLRLLSSDQLRGRPAATEENRQVTSFISKWFSDNGLRPYRDTGLQQLFYIDPTDSANTISNVIGFLPGNTRPEEIVVISAHFDHLSPEKRYRKDSILNGANDNASGTAVMMALAQHFARRKDNARSLLFCAFNAEERGLLGSAAFVEKIDPQQFVACINLEMLGVPQYGKKRLMISGIRKSDLPKIIGKGLKAAGIRYSGERKEDLFARSDNFSFAYLGIPAHSLMASDDSEKCYHRPCDEMKRMDIENMAILANAIISSIEGIIQGNETPSRISTSER